MVISKDIVSKDLPVMIELEDGYKLVRDYKKVPMTKKEELKLVEDRLESISNTDEPTEEELLLWAVENHPYFLEQADRESLQEQIDILKV